MKPIRPNRPGFTLVELLVVIAIVALLFSLLIPAIHRAKYAAGLVQCASNQRQIAISFIAYAQANKNYWPARNLYTGEKPTHIRWSNATYDWRPMLRKVLPSVNRNLQCPLSLTANVDASSAFGVESSYAFYAPWNFIGYAANARLDDSFAFGTKRFKLLVADFLNDQSGSWVIASHPDRANTMRSIISSNSSEYLARWQNSLDHRRGELDLNFTSNDGSLLSLRRIVPDDTRLTQVTYTNNTSLNTAFRWWLPNPD